MKSQYSLFWDEHRKIADLNRAVMDLINDPVNPMTDADLRSLIEKRPNIYGRFSGFVGMLSAHTDQQQCIS